MIQLCISALCDVYFAYIELWSSMIPAIFLYLDSTDLATFNPS